MGDPIRIQKILAQAGFGSRRACETFIEEGRVTVDGAVIRQLGTKADPETQVIELDGQKVAGPGRTSKTVREAQDKVYYMLNKPRGVLSTNEDPSGRPLAIQLVPEKRRIYCVGRLDLDTEGLLLLTNDGELTNQLTHPRYGVDKIYIAKVDGQITQEQIKKLERGVHLAEGKTQGAGIRIRKRGERTSVIELTISEGMNRQVRRMLAAVGLYVRELRRVGVGPLRLGELPTGASRRLTSDEVERLQAAIRRAQAEAKEKGKRVQAAEEDLEVEEELEEEEVEAVSRPWEKRDRKAPAARRPATIEEEAAEELAEEDLDEDLEEDEVLEEEASLEADAETETVDEDVEEDEDEEVEAPEPQFAPSQSKDRGAPVEEGAGAALASSEARDKQRIGKLTKKPWADRGEGRYEAQRPRRDNRRGGDAGRERPWERDRAERGGRDRGERGERSERGGGRKPWERREGGAARGGKPWERREGGAARAGKPWERREGSAARGERTDRAPRGDRGGRSDRPWERDRAPGEGRERRPWQSRGEAGAKPWQKRDGGQRGERTDRGERGDRGGKPWERREGGAARGERGGKPWERREGGAARGGKPWEKREGGSGAARGGKPWEKREGGGSRAGKPWERRESGAGRGGKPWEKREGGGRGERGQRSERGGFDRPRGQGSRDRGTSDRPWESRGGGRERGGSGGGGAGARPARPWERKQDLGDDE